LVAVVTKPKTYAVPMSGYSQEKSFAVVAETRRKWTVAERKQIVAETEAASVSSVARKHGVAASLVFRWRREAGIVGKKSPRKPAAAAVFVPVALPAPLAAATSAPALGIDRGVIEIELGQGRRLRVSGPVEMEALRRVIAVLDGR
jgi:transposase